MGWFSMQIHAHPTSSTQFLVKNSKIVIEYNLAHLRVCWPHIEIDTYAFDAPNSTTTTKIHQFIFLLTKKTVFPEICDSLNIHKRCVTHSLQFPRQWFLITAQLNMNSNKKEKNLNGTKVMMMMLDSEFIRMIQFLKIQNGKKKNQPTYRWKHEEDGKILKL